MSQLQDICTGLVASVMLAACGYQPPPCAGLPDDLPSDWAVVPPGFDTEAFDEVVREHLRDGCLPSFTATVVDRDGPVLTASWGYANLETEQPATTQTPYMIASISKAVDALAIQVAQEQGLLDLDDMVSDLVGFEVENHRTGAGPDILLRHLVTHSSGIRDNYDEIGDSYTTGDHPVSLDDFTRGYLLPGGSYFHSRDNFHLWPAGREWMYSNIGAALAGLAVEVQSGQPYNEYSQQYVLDPLDMQSSGWFLADFDDTDLIARPHVMTADGWDVLEHYGYPTYPDGQVRATPRDLGRMLRMVLGEGEVDGVRVLSAQSVRQMLEQPIPGLQEWFLGDFQEQYVFWFGAELGDRWVVGHDGFDKGVSTSAYVDPAAGVGVVLMTNATGGGPEPYAEAAALLEELFEIGEANQ